MSVVLIISTNNFFQQMTANLLEKDGHECFCFKNFDDILSTLHEKQTNLIIFQSNVEFYDKYIPTIQQQYPSIKILGMFLRNAPKNNQFHQLVGEQTLPIPFDDSVFQQTVTNLLITQ